ncbi:MAG: HAD family hydrolase [Opitutae bacterium]|nr:HAD family hydrolase [Opitutae bacterium]
MKLVMFDMDGTLTDAFAIDENCYVLAIEQALGLPGGKTEWDTYAHTTASFCLEEIVRRARGHPPTAAESRAVQARMVALMADITRRTGRRTREIPGATACMHELQRRGYAVAIASGDWESTARHKFASAGIPFEGLPAAFCDVAHPRTDIMRTALARAARHYGRERFERITYVADAAWDVRACRELGWPLVGVGTDGPAARLPALGVTHVVPHYLDFDAFLAAIEQAEVPRPVPA